MIVNKLTIDGRDYFLPDPVDRLKADILEAVRSGGGYVTIPGLRGGPGVSILFSPGMPVTWVKMDIADPTPAAVHEGHGDEALDALDL
jgi:hypothetical protein